MFRRSGSLLLLLALTGCVGTFVPVKVRPGSNIALPDNGSWVESIVLSVMCANARNANIAPCRCPNDRSALSAPCGPAQIDSIPQTIPVPPVKRP